MQIETTLLATTNEDYSARDLRYTATTDSDHTFNIVPNLLERDLHADRPNQKLVGDICCIWTREGWAYLAVILDLHSQRVVGWAISNRLKKDLAPRLEVTHKYLRLRFLP